MGKSEPVTVEVKAPTPPPTPPGEYSLKVKVLSKEGKPVAGAAVRVSNAVDKKETTDVEGVADFGTLPGGEYAVTVSAAGYREYKDTIKLDADTTYEAVLEPAFVPALVWTLVPLAFGLVAVASSR
jgi:uncharacterized membrane protein